MSVGGVVSSAAAWLKGIDRPDHAPASHSIGSQVGRVMARAALILPTLGFSELILHLATRKMATAPPQAQDARASRVLAEGNEKPQAKSQLPESRGSARELEESVKAGIRFASSDEAPVTEMGGSGVRSQGSTKPDEVSSAQAKVRPELQKLLAPGSDARQELVFLQFLAKSKTSSDEVRAAAADMRDALVLDLKHQHKLVPDELRQLKEVAEGDNGRLTEARKSGGTPEAAFAKVFDASGDKVKEDAIGAAFAKVKQQVMDEVAIRTSLPGPILGRLPTEAELAQVGQGGSRSDAVEKEKQLDDLMASLSLGEDSGPEPSGVGQSKPGAKAPGRHLVYAPFAPVPGTKPLATSWEPHAKYTVTRHDGAAKPLANAKADTTVYVVCHCSARGTTVTDNADGELSARELAQRLRDDGLPKDLKKLKLYACEGGVGGTQSFAFELAAELRKLGYNDLSLYGYTSTVTSLDKDTGKKHGYDHELVTRTDEAGKQTTVAVKKEVPASTKRILIDSPALSKLTERASTARQDLVFLQFLSRSSSSPPDLKLAAAAARKDLLADLRQSNKLSDEEYAQLVRITDDDTTELNTVRGASRGEDPVASFGKVLGVSDDSIKMKEIGSRFAALRSSLAA